MSIPRYEAIQVDGQWFVIDHKCPAAALEKRMDESDARITARVWNLFVNPIEEPK